MKNITDLRNQLIENFELLKSKRMETKEGSILNSTAGKILHSAKLEMDYKRLSKSDKEIDFLK